MLHVCVSGIRNNVVRLVCRIVQDAIFVFHEPSGITNLSSSILDAQ